MERGRGESVIAHDHNNKKLDVQAIDMQKRIEQFLGDENLVRGSQIWVDRGYPDLFYELLDTDEEFAEQVRMGHMSQVLNRLEKEALELENNNEDWNVDEKEAGDKQLVAALREVQTKYKLQWAAVYLGLAASLGGQLYKLSRRLDSREYDTNHHLAINYDNLQNLDSEATPERIDAILATFPKGFTNEIGLIDFINERYAMHESYGSELHKHSQAVATAEGGLGGADTGIVFWRGMKGAAYGIEIFGTELISVTKESASSRSIWSRTLAHEGSHAGDWKRSGRLTKTERASLKVAVYDRVQSEDRYISAYVESISNEDKEEELNIKAEEYWAEIGGAYFDGELNLPEADYKLVDEFVKKMDPNFDRDKALQARLEITSKMNKEQAYKRYKEIEAQFKTLSPLMRDRYQAWLDQHELNADKAIDKALQQQGRQELVAFLDSKLTDAERGLVLKYIVFCQDREFLLASLQADKTGVKKLKTLPPSDQSLEVLFFDAQEIDEQSKSFGNARAEKLLSAVDQIVNANDLDFTTFRAGLFTEDEKQQLFSILNDNSEPLLFNTDWRDENDNFLDLDYFVNNQ